MTSAGFNIVTVYSKLMPNDRHLSIGYVGHIVLTEYSLFNYTVRSIAEVIREQVARAREPENLRRIVGLEDELCDRTTETGLSHWIFPYEGTVLINNTLKVPLRSQHFGYPGKMRFCELR
jgi:hypothetical protein